MSLAYDFVTCSKGYQMGKAGGVDTIAIHKIIGYRI
jgi:hypothetical protein